LVLDSVRALSRDDVTVLDIGCGHGFDGDADLQRSIGDRATHFIGVEPDGGIVPPPYFTEVHRCTLERAALAPDSVDVAYSTFVLEHVQDPARFWDQLYTVLRPGGIFWGFTVDARHPFCLTSLCLDKLRLKDVYLNCLRGKRGTERYENYPTFYRANSPRQIRRHARMFTAATFLTVHREGQLNYYFPRAVWRFLHLAERVMMKLGLPGSMLVVKLEKDGHP
jgi:SAM-dependent methyltransferase